MKFLFFGDIVGRPGRQALAQVVPGWCEQHQPEAVIANVENVAHGKGTTAATLDELMSLGFTAFTSGDHAFELPNSQELLSDSKYPIVRPANYPAGAPGVGARRISVGSRDLLLVNVQGRVFMREGTNSPFTVLDDILNRELVTGNLAGIVVDVHAEATSEKSALGWYLDGRATAVLGTHTHVPTCDEWIMPGGTAFVTDVGMTGVRESVIGVKKEQSLARFLTALPTRFEPAEIGTVMVTAMLVTFDPATRQATAIERLTKNVTIA